MRLSLHAMAAILSSHIPLLFEFMVIGILGADLSASCCAAQQDAAKTSPSRRKGKQKQKAGSETHERTVDSAEAAMRALLLVRDALSRGWPLLGWC